MEVSLLTTPPICPTSYFSDASETENTNTYSQSTGLHDHALVLVRPSGKMLVEFYMPTLEMPKL